MCVTWLSNICRPPSSAINLSTSWSRTPWSALRRTWRSSGGKARGNTHPSTRSGRTRWAPSPACNYACAWLSKQWRCCVSMPWRLWTEYDKCTIYVTRRRRGPDSSHDNHIPLQWSKREVWSMGFLCTTLFNHESSGFGFLVAVYYCRQEYDQLRQIFMAPWWLI